MIRYRLKCPQDHSFEAWFASAEACEEQIAAGLVSCAHCGATQVEKALMTPQVRPARKAEARSGGGPETLSEAGSDAPLSQPQTAAEEALAAMRREIEANSDYVGLNFVREARAMHEGATPERAIHGEAKLEEARALLDDGIPVTPLPFLPKRSSN